MSCKIRMESKAGCTCSGEDLASYVNYFKHNDSCPLSVYGIVKGVEVKNDK